MSFISAGGDLTPNGIELVGDDLTCVDFARRRLRGRRFDPDSLWDRHARLIISQVMAWYRQATSHYLSLCWPRSLSPYGVTRPQWVNLGLWPFWLWPILEAISSAWDRLGSTSRCGAMLPVEDKIAILSKWQHLPDPKHECTGLDESR